jgi:hypothetical protein
VSRSSSFIAMFRSTQIIITTLLVAVAGICFHIPESSQATTIRSTVKFQPRPAGGLRNSIGDEVSLGIEGVTAVSYNTAFLYGVSSLGSVILRTQDGGRHWQEMMTSDDRSRIRWVGFANAQVGWAMLEDYWGEAGGPITLHRTLNGGKTWKALSMVPTNSRYWALLNIRIFSDQQIQVDIFDAPDSNETPAQYAFSHKTVDGGKTWQTRSIVYVPNKMQEQYIKEYQQLILNRSIGFDGSHWQLAQSSDQDTILVQRKVSNSGNFDDISIPSDWGYRQGRIVPR